MPLVMDPAGHEIRALQKSTEWQGRRVLEVGCGDGRLTLRLAAFAPAHIDAIDPEASLLRRARRNRPAGFRGRIRFGVGSAGALRFPSDRYDIVVFSWVL